MNALREQAQQALRTWMSRSQESLAVIAPRIGFTHRSMIQFVSGARWGAGEGEIAARRILEWIDANPVAPPELPGKLYETRATREMDSLLRHVNDGGWGVLYGPSGAQKSFLLEYRGAEAAREAEPRLIYIRCSPSGMSPNVLLRRIAAGLGAWYAQSTDGLRQQVLAALRRRSTPVGLAIDEADGLYRRVDTLETLREIGDLARTGRARLGILIAGNERVMEIFRDRPGVYMEKWRGRIQQDELRVIGPSVDEGRAMLEAELGPHSGLNFERILEGCTVLDPVCGKKYVTAHRLFNAVREARKHLRARA
jgi:type II secretory pathway predicted ATPase ExeA